MEKRTWFVILMVALIGMTSLGGLSLVGCVRGSEKGAQPQELEKVKVQLNWVNDAEAAGFWAALENGYYKEEGLEVEFLPGGPQVDYIGVVAGGGAMLGRAGASMPLIKARLQGVPVKAFGTTFQQLMSGLVSLAKNPIRTPQDAVGKKIGLQTGARMTWSMILRNAGLKEDQMQIVSVGVDPTPLVTGEVDAFYCYIINQPLALKAQGLDVVVASNTQLGLPGYSDLFYTTEDVLKNKEDVVVRWLRATIRGLEYNQLHPEEVARLCTKYGGSGLDVNHQIEVNKAQIPYQKSPLTEEKGLCWMDPAVWENTIKMMYETKQIERLLPADDIMTLKILEKAYGGK